MKISIVTHNFPHPQFPQSGAFVQKLADGMAIAGAKVKVYSLVSKTHLLFRRHKNSVRLRFADGVEVKYLDYLSFSNFNILGFSTAKLGYQFSFKRLKKEVEFDVENEGKPDVLYGKFLLSGGRKVVELSREFTIPAVADIGESTLLERLAPAQIRVARDIVKDLKGAVCVSPRLVSEMVELGMNPDRILMLPNGIDTERFYPIDRIDAREALALPVNNKIVVFVGHFIHRKGADRVLKAIESLPSEYCGVFLGEGSISLESDRVLFKGRVANDELNTWLNAADVFCLPTLAEGSCNAIEEARAVGLPIVTSNIPDITDFESSQDYILVNPINIDDIASGIEQACAKGRPQYLSKPMSNSDRSKTIVEWLSKIIY